ncbi:MAG: SUMF1/EgtB/PvdO family nonheme iron enzyme [Spirochaetota bacterium]
MKTKSLLNVMFGFFVIIIFSLTGCDWFSSDSDNGDSGGDNTVTDIFDAAKNPGDVVNVTAGSKNFNMIYANNKSTTIPTGVDDDGSATLNINYFIGETEVTNALAVEVLQWAHDNGKFSDTESDHNGLSSSTAKYGSRQLIDLDNAYSRVNYSAGSFTVDSGYENHPVVCVTWFGAVMMCNWLAEMQDGTTNNLVYSGIDTSWEYNETVEDPLKSGYRLPSLDEWELAARYIDGTEWLYGDHASGDESGACWWDGYEGSILGGQSLSTVFGDYAWYRDNSGELTHEVKQKLGNALGIYDMSGNIGEWCWARAGSLYEGQCCFRSGSCYGLPMSLTVGISYSPGTDPTYPSRAVGLRIAKSKP